MFRLGETLVNAEYEMELYIAVALIGWVLVTVFFMYEIPVYKRDMLAVLLCGMLGFLVGLFWPVAMSVLLIGGFAKFILGDRE